jgi:hypothetical protein
MERRAQPNALGNTKGLLQDPLKQRLHLSEAFAEAQRANIDSIPLMQIKAAEWSATNIRG